MAGGQRTDDTDGRLKFQWYLQVVTPDGAVKVADIVECDYPKAKVDVVQRGAPGKNHKIKKPGMISFEDVKFKMVMPTIGANHVLWNWLMRAANPVTGRATPAPNLRRKSILFHIDDVGSTIEKFEFHKSWISELGGEKHEASSEYQYEEGTLTYDYYTRVAG